MVIILTYFMTIYMVFMIPRLSTAGNEFLEPPNSLALVVRLPGSCHPLYRGYAVYTPTPLGMRLMGNWSNVAQAI